jgi:hypothetical protein
MTRLFFFLLFVTGVGSVSGQTDFQIGPISLDKSVYSAKFPTANITPSYFPVTRVSVPADMASTEFIFKAYYFSESGAELSGGVTGHFTGTKEKDRKFAGANGGFVSMPAKLEAGKRYEVQFGAPSGIKWKHVIVVIGKKGDLVGKIHPKADWTKFDFPDKATVRVLQ